MVENLFFDTSGGRVLSRPLCDVDIRQPLHEWLLLKHAGASDTSIVHELKIPRPSARIDVAVVNGELVGFEIKSDIDSLSRLPRQAAAFAQVFDKVFIVTTPKHVDNALKQIPPWWGVLLPTTNKNDVTTFKPARKPTRNPVLNNRSLLHVLTKRELVGMCQSRNKIPKGIKSKSKNALIEIIIEKLSSRTIRCAARKALRQRAAAISCA